MPLEVTRTTKPSTIICHDDSKGHFFTVTTRTGAPILTSYVDVLDEISFKIFSANESLYSEAFDERNAFIKPRHVFYDDKHGVCIVDVDYIHDQSIKPTYTKSQIQEMLGDGTAGGHRQGFGFEVRIVTGIFGSDYFHPNNKEYYEQSSDSSSF